VVQHGVGGLVDDRSGRLDGVAGPFLHGGAVDCFFAVLNV
jgi:hypothetical protein